jgi:hypothetical protein
LSPSQKLYIAFALSRNCVSGIVRKSSVCPGMVSLLHSNACTFPTAATSYALNSRVWKRLARMWRYVFTNTR